MRTNIVIDDKLMAAAMATGDFKTKREAVEEGLRQIARRKAYAGLLAARGTLHWDDSDEAWAEAAKEQALENQAQTPSHSVQEPVASYPLKPVVAVVKPQRAGIATKGMRKTPPKAAP